MGFSWFYSLVVRYYYDTVKWANSSVIFSFKVFSNSWRISLIFIPLSFFQSKTTLKHCHFTARLYNSHFKNACEKLWANPESHAPSHPKPTLTPNNSKPCKMFQTPCLCWQGQAQAKPPSSPKIAYLITQCNMPAERITAVTFTNKAAREMKARVQKLLPSEKTKGLTVSTFHQFGLQFLRLQCDTYASQGQFFYHG